MDIQIEITTEPIVGQYIIATEEITEDVVTNRGVEEVVARPFMDAPYKVLAFKYPFAVIERTGGRYMADVRRHAFMVVPEEFVGTTQSKGPSILAAILGAADGPCPVHGEKCPDESHDPSRN